MPGSSLWLLPPRDHPLNATLSHLIAQTARRFDSPHTFLPHVTLTSDVAGDVYDADPQAWLDALAFPQGREVEVRLGPLASEDVLVRKLYSLVAKDGVEDLTRIARGAVDGDAASVEEWVKERWTPHLSLLYHDCPRVGEEEIREVGREVEEAGVRMNGVGEMGGWRGGRVVLVDTSRPIGEWVPVAERKL